ncbi:MAG: 30S ribosomal protein S17 [Holosporales bacterium]|jgi:small subunit ribosomal protein S17|nr:30S ribosomal protein S17 [Holosporales bacterium]
MPRRILTGVVKGNKSDKTVAVTVVRRVVHPKYRKYVNKRHTCYAHDPHNVCEIGQTVTIRECPPFSKTKRWEVLYENGSHEFSVTTAGKGV